MSGKTKIVVLHMKELIYTGIFVILGILFIILMIMMFVPGKDNASDADAPQTMQHFSDNTKTNLTADTTQDTPPGTDAIAQNSTVEEIYIPGIYTTELVLGEQSINVEVIVDKSSITSIRLNNLEEAITTMYPLLQPTFDSICEQIYTLQTIEGVTYSTDAKYTSLVLLEAIGHSLEKAVVE